MLQVFACSIKNNCRTVAETVPQKYVPYMHTVLLSEKTRLMRLAQRLFSLYCWMNCIIVASLDANEGPCDCRNERNEE